MLSGVESLEDCLLHPSITPPETIVEDIIDELNRVLNHCTTYIASSYDDVAPARLLYPTIMGSLSRMIPVLGALQPMFHPWDFDAVMRKIYLMKCQAYLLDLRVKNRSLQTRGRHPKNWL